MVKVSEIGPGTPVGKQILEQFLNWEKTNFKPWGPNVGGKNHYNSSAAYRVVSASAFRSQAKKIARVALEQLVADEQSRVAATNGGLILPGQDSDDDDDDKSPPIDSLKKNPSVRFGQDGNAKEYVIVDDKDEESNDESYTMNDDDNSSDDSLPEDEYLVTALSELQISRAPFLIEYPSGDKLLVIFPLDGNVADAESTQFEFIQDNTAIRRLGKVPKEREDCLALIGSGTDKRPKLGFTDIDFMVVDLEIQKRLNKYKSLRDEKGNIWEIRATLQLPFKCHPHFYTKDGKVLKSFRMRSNGRGFFWGFFWLLAWTPQKPKPLKRVEGKLVKIISEEKSSLYTEMTFETRRSRKK